MEFDEIILGGTFDHLHEGHKAFLRFALERGHHILIGLTSDSYVAEHKGGNVLSFAKRKEELEHYLSEIYMLNRVKIVSIDSRFDQTQVLSGNIALLVSSETYQSGLDINREREKQGFAPLPLLVMPLVVSETGEKISSSKIREGLFDREGNFLSAQFMDKPLVIPSSLRESLHKPFGTLYMQEIPDEILNHPEKLITVGDVTTKRIHDMHVSPKLAVVDFKVERKDTNVDLLHLGFTGKEEVFDITNPPGEILPQTWKALVNIIKNISEFKNIAVIVKGEEDLFVLPLLLLLPLGYTILYGQPNEGLVVINVTEEHKKLLVQLLQTYL